VTAPTHLDDEDDDLRPRPGARIWPKIDGTEDLPDVVDVHGHGRWCRSPGTDVYINATSATPSGFYSHADLRELGEVREVLG
jgi:hypothetical protein